MFEPPMRAPHHCAEVSVFNAGAGFTPEVALADLRGHPTYYQTRYIIVREREGSLHPRDRVAVLEVEATGDQLVRTIVGGTVVAPPEECLVVVDPSLDEFTVNHVVLRAVAARTDAGVKAVVLSGRGENVTFVALDDCDVPADHIYVLFAGQPGVSCRGAVDLSRRPKTRLQEAIRELPLEALGEVPDLPPLLLLRHKPLQHLLPERSFSVLNHPASPLNMWGNYVYKSRWSNAKERAQKHRRQKNFYDQKG